MKPHSKYYTWIAASVSLTSSSVAALFEASDWQQTGEECKFLSLQYDNPAGWYLNKITRAMLNAETPLAF